MKVAALPRLVPCPAPALLLGLLLLPFALPALLAL